MTTTQVFENSFGFWESLSTELHTEKKYNRNEKYPFEEIQNEQITLEPTITEIKSDIEKTLRVSADETSPVFKDVVKMLCLVKVGDSQKPIYFRNHKAKFGVSKINS